METTKDYIKELSSHLLQCNGVGWPLSQTFGRIKFIVKS